MVISCVGPPMYMPPTAPAPPPSQMMPPPGQQTQQVTIPNEVSQLTLGRISNHTTLSYRT